MVSGLLGGLQELLESLDFEKRERLFNFVAIRGADVEIFEVAKASFDFFDGVHLWLGV